MAERCCYILLLFLRGICTAGGVAQPRFLQTTRVRLLLGLGMSPKCPRTPRGHPVKGIPWILPELLLDWRQLCSCCNFLGGIVWFCWLLSFFFF